MYILGFGSSYFLVLYQLKKKAMGITKAQIDDIYFYLILGLLAGARLGYVLFYNLPFYLSHPLEIFVLWHGGMSFHGGAIGTFVLGYWAMRRRGISFLKAADLITPTIPLGPVLWANGEFHQRRALGKAVDSALGHDLPYGRQRGAPSRPSFTRRCSRGSSCSRSCGFTKTGSDARGTYSLFFSCFMLSFARAANSSGNPIFRWATSSVSSPWDRFLSIIMLAIGVLLKYVFLPRIKKGQTIGGRG